MVVVMVVCGGGTLGDCCPWLCGVSVWKAALCKSLKPLHLNQFGEVQSAEGSPPPLTGGRLRKQLLTAPGSWGGRHGRQVEPWRGPFLLSVSLWENSRCSCLEPSESSNRLHHLLPRLRSSWLPFVSSTWSAGIWDIRGADRCSGWYFLVIVTELETCSRIRFLLGWATHPSEKGSPPFCSAPIINNCWSAAVV